MNRELFRSIKGSLGRFLAIAAITALGCGFFAGLLMTCPDMKQAADRYYDGTSLFDIRVVSTLGLSEDDLAALGEVEGVEAVMGAYETDVIALFGEEQFATRVHSLPAAAADSESDGRVIVTSENDAYLNRLVLKEGAWPTSSGECVVSADIPESENVQIGDTIVFTECSSDMDDTLACTEYTVVGKASSSYYVESTTLGTTSLGSGSIDDWVYILEDDFAEDYPCTEAFISVAGAADLDASSDEYQAAVDETASRIEAIAGLRAQLRVEELKADAQDELDEATAEYEQAEAEAREELDEAALELAEAQEELDEALAALTVSEALLQSAADQLEEAEADLESAQEDYDAGVSELAAQRAEAEQSFAEAQAQIDAIADIYPEQAAEAQADLDLQWEEAQAQFDAYQEELDEALYQIECAREEIEQGRAEYEAGLAELEEGWAEYEAGLAELEEGRAEYEEAEAEAQEQLAEAKAELDDAQAQIDELEAADWLILDRTSNYGAASWYADAERIGSIARIFPLIFFLVAALVALTTMTRMVKEERSLIGTFKALGYSRARITAKYILYAAIASLAGAVLGVAALTQVLPLVIIKAYSIIYSVPTLPMPQPIGPVVGIASIALGVGITLLATWAAATATLRETPASLMQPRAPKAGRRILLERIGPVWRRLGFSQKVAARNLFRYKKRLVMTVIGIAGCTGLLLTGLGLSDSINDIIDKQFGEITFYNTQITLDDDADEEDFSQTETLMEESGMLEGSIRAYRESMLAGGPEDDDLSFELVVFEDVSEIEGFTVLRDRKSGEEVELASDGLVLTEKLASELGVGVGDQVTLTEQDDSGNPTSTSYTATVAGIAENYIRYYMYMGPDLYEQLTGTEASPNTVFAIVGEGEAEREELGDVLRDGVDSVKTVAYNDETIESYRSALSSVNMIVVVLVVAAAALAFIVLYNLTNINITERVREIATLKVLGFTPAEVCAYIYREILVLSIIGALCGLVFGVALEGFVVVTAEVDQVMFGREIHPPSFAIAFLLTLVFTAIVMVFMRGKLARVDMVESLKSVE